MEAKPRPIYSVLLWSICCWLAGGPKIALQSHCCRLAAGNRGIASDGSVAGFLVAGAASGRGCFLGERARRKGKVNAQVNAEVNAQVNAEVNAQVNSW